MVPNRRKLKAPFPWFGGKSRVSHLVWPAFGDVPNYVEPFAGSLAVLLLRPHEPRNETVNDLDCYIANFWRALQNDPEAVARYADWPVNEADLHARHRWLHSQEAFRERMHIDPDYYDAKVAGWWVWGLSAWIGDNWCRVNPQKSMPGFRGKGISGVALDGLWNARPHLREGGQGVHRTSLKRPNITGFSLKGVHKPTLHNKRPNLKRGCNGVQSERALCLSQAIPDISGDSGASGRGVHAKYTGALYEYFHALRERLRRVRVCCGEWHRILGPSPTVHIGITAVFLDPPYGSKKRDKVYSHDSFELAGAVRAWCKEHGDDKRLRIALCGYEGEHNELEGLDWYKIRWVAAGGYGSRNPENKNAERERIWFSPHCLDLRQKDLFE